MRLVAPALGVDTIEVARVRAGKLSDALNPVGSQIRAERRSDASSLLGSVLKTGVPAVLHRDDPLLPDNERRRLTDAGFATALLAAIRTPEGDSIGLLEPSVGNHAPGAAPS